MSTYTTEINHNATATDFAAALRGIAGAADIDIRSCDSVTFTVDDEVTLQADIGTDYPGSLVIYKVSGDDGTPELDEYTRLLNNIEAAIA